MTDLHVCQPAESQNFLSDLPLELLTSISDFVDGLTLLELRLVNKGWFTLMSLSFCQPILQKQLAFTLSAWIIGLDVGPFSLSILKRFGQRLDLILTSPLHCDPKETNRKQFFRLNKADLKNLSVPELRYCIIFLNDVNSINIDDVKSELYPDQLIWLSTNSLIEIEEQVNEIYPSLTSDIMYDYKTIIMSQIELRRIYSVSSLGVTKQAGSERDPPNACLYHEMVMWRDKGHTYCMKDSSCVKLPWHKKFNSLDVQREFTYREIAY